MNLNFDTLKEIQAFINGNESGMFDGENEAGEEVIIYLSQGQGMDMVTYQNNGWIRFSTFDASGIKTDETYKGRWDNK